MNSVVKVVMFGIFMSSVFAGCAPKANSTLACFKGKPACYTQQIKTPKEACLTCVATI